MTATYTLPPATSVDKVRYQLGDTDLPDVVFQDEEIQFSLDQNDGDINAATYDLTRLRIGRVAGLVDMKVGDASISLSQSMAGAKEAWAAAQASSATNGSRFAMPYAGGISLSDKLANDQDSDRPVPEFRRRRPKDWFNGEIDD